MTQKGKEGATDVKNASARWRPTAGETVLVEQGQPLAVIVIPDEPEYGRLAESIVDKVKKLAGVSLALQKAGDLVDPRTRLLREQYQSRNLILIGAFFNNQLLRILYVDYMDPTDAFYPGEGGYTLRSVPAAFAPEQGCLVVGASDLAGAKKAVKNLVSCLKAEGNKVTVPFLCEVHATGPCREQLHALSGGLPDDWQEYVDRHFRYGAPDQLHLGLGQPTINLGDWYTQLWVLFGRLAIHYQLTGDDRLGQAAALVFRRLLATPDPFSDNPLLAYYDYVLPLVISGWDVLEHTPWVDNAFRDEVVRRLVAMLAQSMKQWYYLPWATQDKEHFWMERHALAAMWMYGRACRYLNRQAELNEEAASLKAKWEADTEAVFRELSQAPYYYADRWDHHMTMLVLHHEMATGKGTYLKDNLHLAAELHLLFGVPLYGPQYIDEEWCFSTPVLRAADLVYGTRAYSSYYDVEVPLEKCVNHFPVYYIGLRGCYWWALPKQAKGLKKHRLIADGDVAHLPHPRLIYDSMKNQSLSLIVLHPEFFKATSLPCEEVFQILRLQHGEGKLRQFLWVSGIAGTQNGASIARMAAIPAYIEAGVGFIPPSPPGWGAQVDMAKVVAEHGRRREPDGYAAGLKASVDMPGFALVTVVVPEYGGSDWQRSIVWEKGGPLAFFDSVRARTAGDVHVASRWPVGQAEIKVDARAAEARRGEATMHVLDGSGARMSLRKAGPAHMAMQQVEAQQEIWRSLDAGEEAHLASLLYVDQPARRQKYSVEPVGEAAMLLTGQHQGRKVRAAVGVGPLDTSGLNIQAAGWRLGVERAFFAMARDVKIGGKELLAGDEPISAEVDWASGTVILQAERSAQARLAGKTISVTGGQKEISLSDVGTWRKTVAKVLADLQPTPRGSAQKRQVALGGIANISSVQATPTATAYLWAPGRFENRPGVVLAKGSEMTAYVANNGRTKQVWRKDMGEDVHCIWAGDLDADGSTKTAAGTTAAVTVLDEQGKEVWANSWYTGETAGGQTIQTLAAEDLDGDGEAEVFGSHYKVVFCIGRDGRTKWQKFTDDSLSTHIGALDFNGDGKKEVVLAAGWRTLHVFWPDEQYSTRFKLEGTAAFESAGFVFTDVDGDGLDDVVFGDNERLAAYSPVNRKCLWNWPAGSALKGIMLVGEGPGRRILVACEGGFLNTFDLTGRLEKSVSLHERINCAAPTRVGQPLLWLAMGNGTVRVVDGTGEARGACDLKAQIVGLKAVPDAAAVVAATSEGTYHWLGYEPKAS